MTDTSALNDQQFMDALLDIVLPPNAAGSLPGAGPLGLSGQVAAGLKSDPMLGPMVEAAMGAIQAAALSQHPDGLRSLTPEARKELVQAQAAANPFFMMGLARYLYPAYYQHPQVLAGIGVPARPPFPEGYSVEPTDPELLEKLLARRKQA
jgi:hypothetical protein